MKIFLCYLFIISCVFNTNALGNEELKQEGFEDRYVLILKSTKDCADALNFASNFSQKIGIKFDNETRHCSNEKGVYFDPEDTKETKESYWPRRYQDDGLEFISLENSKEYGFKKGYILVVAGVYAEKTKAKIALKKVKGIVKDAYLKKAKSMWMGCIH